MAKGKKASLVQCRIEACQKVDEIAKLEDVSITKAMKLLAGASGVPVGTLNHWYYCDDESSPKVRVDQDPEKAKKNKAKVAAKIVSNINKALDKDEEDALAANANREGAQALANELGGAVLAEELYELFLKKTTELDRIIRANSELDDPMDATKVIEQLLRMARNVGWEEYKPPADLCKKCRIEKVTCPNRTCENNVPKKKQVKGKAKAKGE